MSKIHPAWDEKRKRGDRFDGTLIKKLDPMHVITPILYPNRCDNEAFFLEELDITRLRAYAKKMNEEIGDEVKYSIFQLFVMCVMKLIYMRPKLNRFIANRLMYQRKEYTASFIVKKTFKDDAGEALAIINIAPDDNVYTLHEKIAAQITSGKSDDEVDKSSESMDIVSKMPRRLTRAFCQFICFLDKIGKCPKGLIDTDPYYTTVLLANLGSIGLSAGYHHLTNWGTNSIFVVVGDIKKKEVELDDGTKEVHEFLQIGMTIDERLADGFYYSKSIRLLKRIIAHPEFLEKPMSEEIK